MKIILVGCGKVGTALARQLSEEGHNVTIIDTNKARVEHISESYDVMGITGNGSSITTLSEAGIEEADVFIAVTGSDELNLLCCMFAKKAGHCHAIARVRNPSYSHELDFIKKQIGISAIINPEMAAAREISHLLRFPGASKIDTFAEGRVRLIKFTLTEAQALDGVAIREIPTRLKSDILVCAVERDGGVIIPNGNFVLQTGDQVTFLATQEKAHEFFQRIHLAVRPVRNAFIVGGGAIAFYLSQELLENHVRVRIVERDPARCMELAEQLQDCGIQAITVHGRTRSQMYTGEADWEMIARVKENPRLRIPVIGNGDITTPERLVEAFDRYGVDGVMVGRAAIGNPWVFYDMKQTMLHGCVPEPLTLERKFDILRRQIDESISRIDEYRGILHIRRHLAVCSLFKGLPYFRETRISMLRANTKQELFDIIASVQQRLQRGDYNTDKTDDL